MTSDATALVARHIFLLTTKCIAEDWGSFLLMMLKWNLLGLNMYVHI
jgi:hypothetical protein